MPTLAAPAGPAPSLLSLLTPVAVSPAAPVDGPPVPSFADIVAGLIAPPALPAMPVPTGQALPVERPKIAGPAPDPVPDVDAVMVGCEWSPELDQPSAPVLPTPVTFKPIARFEPELHTPVREVIRLPIRAAILTSAPEAVIVRAVQPEAAIAPELPISEATDTPTEPRQPRQEPELAVTIIIPEQQPAPAPLPVPAPPSAPVPTLPEALPSPKTETAARIAALPIAPARPTLPTAPVEAQPGTAPVSAQADGDPQPDAQQQPQPQPKPALAPATPAELRIAPELTRQVAQMIQPTLERTTDPQPASAPPVDAAMPLPSAPAPQPIAAPAPVPAQPVAFQTAPVDLGRAGWAEAMIQRIAEMPQTDRREAQIKLLPDMLGKVEVTLVQREERVHVTLNVETPQARQLLTEAAPRLQELAEARGLRLAQTEIGGGTSQDRRAPQDQNQPQTPLRNRSAQAEPADDQSTADGERIA